MSSTKDSTSSTLMRTALRHSFLGEASVLQWAESTSPRHCTLGRKAQLWTTLMESVNNSTKTE